MLPCSCNTCGSSEGRGQATLASAHACMHAPLHRTGQARRAMPYRSRWQPQSALRCCRSIHWASRYAGMQVCVEWEAWPSLRACQRAACKYRVWRALRCAAAIGRAALLPLYQPAAPPAQPPTNQATSTHLYAAASLRCTIRRLQQLRVVLTAKGSVGQALVLVGGGGGGGQCWQPEPLGIDGCS